MLISLLVIFIVGLILFVTVSALAKGNILTGQAVPLTFALAACIMLVLLVLVVTGTLTF
jgi:hypothetical protein